MLESNLLWASNLSGGWGGEGREGEVILTGVFFYRFAPKATNHMGFNGLQLAVEDLGEAPFCYFGSKQENITEGRKAGKTKLPSPLPLA